MTVPNLVKRLMKELQRGGKKTIVLGVLLVGGMYFWVPMVWRAVFPKREEPAASPAASSSPAKPTVPAAASKQMAVAAEPTPAAPANWKTLYRRLENLALLEPVALDELVRDPFDHAWIRDKEAPVDPIKSDLGPAFVADPLTAMTLNGVLASSGGGGAAIINNKIYGVGDHIPPEGPVRYVLKSVMEDRVVLEREGNSFEVKVAGRNANRNGLAPEEKP